MPIWSDDPAGMAEQVQAIVARGVRTPRPFRRQLADLWAALGPGVLFWGQWEAVATALLASGTVAGLGVMLVRDDPTLGQVVVVALAPLLLLTLSGFVEALDRGGPLGELRRTCRWSAARITGFRMLCFTAAGALFALPLAGWTGRGLAGEDAVRLLLWALLSVAVAALVQLVLLDRTSGWRAVLAFPLVWLVAWAVLLRTAPRAVVAVLQGVPVLLPAGLLVLAGWGIGWTVRGLFASAAMRRSFGVAGQ